MRDRQTRGRPSKIEQLPAEIKNLLDKLLRDGRHTQQAILAHINQLTQCDHRISRSGLNRYATRMESVGAKLRETREIANAWMSQLGDEPTSDVLQLVVEMMQSVLFKVALKASDAPDDQLFDPNQLKAVALAVQRLSSAAEMNAKRERNLRKAWAQQAANEVEEVVKESGMSEETITAIKNRVLGIR